MSDHIFANFLAGLDEDDDDIKAATVEGPEDLDDFFTGALSSGSQRNLLVRLAKGARTKGPSSPTHRVVKRLAKISRAVLAQTGRIEAEQLRKPNNMASIYCPALAPGASQAFSVQPGSGMSFYRLLGFVISDAQANIFGFSTLKVGGVEHVNFTQSTPAAPVANAVPISTFVIAESRNWAGLAPWSGQVFDNQTPITGTVVNMTTAGAGDAITVAPRISLLTQVDPCGQRYTQGTAQTQSYFKRLRSNLGAYMPLSVGE